MTKILYKLFLYLDKKREVDRDEKIKLEFEVILREQPIFLDQIETKIKSTEKTIEDYILAKQRFVQISQAIENIVQANFELNNPCAAN